MRRKALAALLILAVGVGVAALLSLRLQISIRPNHARAGTEEVFWVESTPGQAQTVRAPSFADLAEAVSPAVVNIRVERRHPPESDDPHRGLFDRRWRGPDSTGSGFIVSPDGYIVTNDHVIRGASHVMVELLDGPTLDAEVVGRDPKTDLALIKVAAEQPLPVTALGDSDRVRVGDWVMAIGTPYGLDHTVTVGVLSAKGRRNVTHDSSYDDFLQTDASINPGNSGGPLFDSGGRVIGINTAIQGEAQGIGFSIPINMAKQLLPQLRAHGMVIRGWLGVQIGAVRPELAESFGLDGNEGALVSRVVPDSAAERAKLQKNDVIVEFDGHPVHSHLDLPRLVAVARPGSDVDVVVVREGKRLTLRATLDQIPQSQPQLGDTEDVPPTEPE